MKSYAGVMRKLLCVLGSVTGLALLAIHPVSAQVTGAANAAPDSES
jgi:hypothetical protein